MRHHVRDNEKLPYYIYLINTMVNQPANHDEEDVPDEEAWSPGGPTGS